MNVQTCLHSPDALRCQAALFDLTNKLDQSETFSIEDVGDCLPGAVMVQDLSRLTNTYMNKLGCDYLRHSKEELEALGPNYFNLFFPPEEIQLLKVELNNFISQNDFSKIYSFFQRVRPHAGMDYKWYLTSTRLYSDPHNLANPKTLNIAIDVSNLGLTTKKMNFICEQNELVQKHYGKYLRLTLREKEIIRLIVDGKSSYAISDMLFISQHTVNNHRKNIIAKLQVKSLSELIKFAVAFCII